MKTELQLKAMNKAEQKAYAKEIGAEIQGNPSEDTIIARILDKQSEPDFVDPEPEEEVQLVVPEFETPVMVLDNGTVYTPVQVVEAAQRDSGLTPGQWNGLSENKLEEEVQEFVDHTNFIPMEEPEPVKTNTYDKARLEKIANEFPEVGFEVRDNYFTITYGRQVESGNLGLSDNVFRNRLNVMTQYE